MKNTKYIHGLSNFGYCGFLAKRLVWQNPEKAPVTEAQKEQKDLGDLVKRVEALQKRVEALGGEHREREGTYFHAAHKLAKAIKEKTQYFSPELLKKLADSGHYLVRIAVADVIKDRDTLNKLAKDESAGVRLSVLKNPYTSEAILKKLAKDEEERIRKAAQDRLDHPWSLTGEGGRR